MNNYQQICKSVILRFDCNLFFYGFYFLFKLFFGWKILVRTTSKCFCFCFVNVVDNVTVNIVVNIVANIVVNIEVNHLIIKPTMKLWNNSNY